MKRSAFLAIIVFVAVLFIATYFFWPRLMPRGPLGPVAVSAQPIQLVPGDPGANKVGRLNYRGGLLLESDNNRFGGYSGLIVDPQSSEVLAISDSGHWLHASLLHHGGELVGLAKATLAPALGMDGTQLSGLEADLEGLTSDPTGHIIVSKERDHKIMVYRFSGPHQLSDALGEQQVPIDEITPPDLDSLTPNGGMEAIVHLQENVLLTVTEGTINPDGTTKGWLVSSGQFHELSYPVRDAFYPVAMSLMPDGNVLVLERRYTLELGPAARLCIIERDKIKPGITLPCPNIAEITSPMAVDNFEGLSVVEGAQGETLVYILSDDNFNPLQDTLLLMFELVDRTTGQP